MKEINRVLKLGGRLYFFEHNPWNPFTRFLVRTCPFDKNAQLTIQLKHKESNLMKIYDFVKGTNDYTVAFDDLQSGHLS